MAAMAEAAWIAAEQGVFVNSLTYITTNWKFRLRLPVYREYFEHDSRRWHRQDFLDLIDTIIQEVDAS